MLETRADVTAVVLLAAFLAVVTALCAWRLMRGPNGPLATFVMGLNRLYLALMFRWSSNGPAPLPRVGPAILVANHASPIDPMVLQAGTDRIISFMVAREYYEVSWLKWLYDRNGAIPVSRSGQDIAATKAALRTLRRGSVLGVFPEGRINLSGSGLLPGRLGVALIALRSRAPVIPAYIQGAPRGFTMIAPFLTPSRVHVTYGQPVDLSPFYGREKERGVLEQATARLMAAVAKLGGVRVAPQTCEPAHQVGTRPRVPAETKSGSG